MHQRPSADDTLQITSCLVYPSPESFDSGEGYTRHGLLRTVADLYGEITSDFFSALIRETGSVFGSRYDREFAHSVRSKRT